MVRPYFKCLFIRPISKLLSNFTGYFLLIAGISNGRIAGAGLCIEIDLNN
jgi:hypothetical protein